MYMKSLLVWIAVALIYEIGPINGQPQCTGDEDFIAFAIMQTQECLNALIALGTGDTSESTVTTACGNDCGGALYNFYLNPCLDPANATNLALGCARNNNGGLCAPLLTDLALTGASFFALCGPLIIGNEEFCSDRCRDVLEAVRDEFGCCTSLLEILQEGGGFLNPFQGNRIFFACGVEPTPMCDNPFFRECPFGQTPCPGSSGAPGSGSGSGSGSGFGTTPPTPPTPICIPTEYICDGITDCPENTDEENCPVIPLTVSFTGGTPTVLGAGIEVEVVVNRRPHALIACFLELDRRTDSGFESVAPPVDCSSGRVRMNYFIGSQSASLRVMVHARTATEQATIRRRVLVDRNRCIVHLINSGVTVNGNTAIIEFEANGPYSNVRCSLDRQAFFSCSSPLLQTGLRTGAHNIKILPVGPACVRNRSAAKANFII